MATASMVSDSRFATIAVPRKMSIRQMVELNGLSFKPGRGFYQLNKAETIQAYKEVVARLKSDGSIITGDAVRSVLKIPKGGGKGKFKIDLGKLPDFDVFVQSTSYNRQLEGGTDFLYEVEDSGSADSALGAIKKKAKGFFGSSLFGSSSGFSTEKSGPIKGKKKFPPFTPPAAGGGPGSPIEVVFSFDTTGSMYSYLAEVRKSISSIIERLLGDIPAIKIAVIAHGDYCDKRSSYVTKIKDFSNNKKDLVSFVNGVGSTGGGDYPECYELVLSEARRLLSWSPGTMRSLVMIGDAIPHKASESQNEYGIDWVEECELLRDQLGCRVYSVQANNMADATTFYKKMAQITGGTYVPLAQIQTIVDLVMAICYREQGAEFLENFRKEVEVRELKKTGSGMNSALMKMFAALKEPETGSVTLTSTKKTTTSGGAAAALLSAAAGKGKGKRPASAAPGPAPKRGRAASKSPAKGAKKAPAKSPPRKPAAKKTPAKKAVAKKTPAKKTPAKKAPVKKPPPKKTTKKVPVKKAAPKKAAKPAAKKGAKKAPAKASPKKRGKK